MGLYQFAWPFLRLLPAEAAHSLGVAYLRSPLPVPCRDSTRDTDAFEWNGLRFRNRVGIAAGFDKNGACIRGIAKMGAAFVEVGTILAQPWQGNPPPRLSRLLKQESIWNRLGFPNVGVDIVAPRLAYSAEHHRLNGMRIACNIGPHPAHLKQAIDETAGINIVRTELLQLLRALHRHADFFVVNLSSPNTAGLRSILASPKLSSEILQPVRETLNELNQSRTHPVPMLLKLPPEDSSREPWTESSLSGVLAPLFGEQICDGIVAVNTSTRLATQYLPQPTGSLPGGISGSLLRPYAIEMIALVRRIIGPSPLIIGSGGIIQPQHACELRDAGANLVELYTGLIYRGPTLISECIETLRG